jgi:hypothetical protein
VSLTDLFASRSLCVALAPGQLTAVVRRGRRVLPDSAARIALDDRDGHWQGALDALQGYLKQGGSGLAGLPLSVGLSSRWCQLAMLPWSDALLERAAAARFIEGQFGAMYGEAARSWAIACDDAPYGQPRLACAIERELLDGLNNIALEHGHPCAGIESALSLAWRAIAGARPAAFAVVEPGRLVLAAAAKGRIVAVQAQSCRADWQAELPLAWQRWTLRAPELGDIAQVALVNLDERAPAADLPPRFRPAALPAAFAAGFAAVCMVGH